MFAGAFSVACAWTGCATAPMVEVPEIKATVAQIVIANLSGYAWRIEARPAQGGEARSWQVLPHASLEIALAGGDYVFTQTIAGATLPVAATPRQFPARFEAGERYEWSLATLLSAEAGESATGVAASSR